MTTSGIWCHEVAPRSLVAHTVDFEPEHRAQTHPALPVDVTVTLQRADFGSSHAVAAATNIARALSGGRDEYASSIST